MFKNSDMEYYMKKGYKNLQKGNYIKAKKYYLKCLAIEPNNITILNNLGQIYKMLGETDKFKGYCEIIIQECDKLLKKEKTENTLLIKSNTLLELKKIPDASNALDELLEISPNNKYGLIRKSECLEIENKNQEAIKYIDRLLEIEPYDIASLLSKGRNLVELNEFDEAEEYYKIVFEMETKNITAFNLKSQLLKKKNKVLLTSHDFAIKTIESWKREDFESALNYIQKAIELDCGYDEIWFLQGELFIRTGYINKAIKSFEKAFELNPTSGGIENKKALFKMLEKMLIINKTLGFEE